MQVEAVMLKRKSSRTATLHNHQVHKKSDKEVSDKSESDESQSEKSDDEECKSDSEINDQSEREVCIVCGMLCDRCSN